MQPLYDRLLAPVFTSSADAIEFCREVCAEFGFTVKQEASANKVNKRLFFFLIFLGRGWHSHARHLRSTFTCIARAKALPNRHGRTSSRTA